MPLAYYDLSINSAYELVLAGLKESKRATGLEELAEFMSVKTDFPPAVCYKVITEALVEGMEHKTIRKTGELYYAVIEQPDKLPKTARKTHKAQVELDMELKKQLEKAKCLM